MKNYKKDIKIYYKNGFKYYYFLMFASIIIDYKK